MPDRKANDKKNIAKPNLPKRLFWDTPFDTIDWKKAYRTIIERVVERGTPDEWKEMIRFYGEQRVIDVLKNEVPYLPKYAIEEVCTYFHIEKGDLSCYIRSQSGKGHWI